MRITPKQAALLKSLLDPAELVGARGKALAREKGVNVLTRGVKRFARSPWRMTKLQAGKAVRFSKQHPVALGLIGAQAGAQGYQVYREERDSRQMRDWMKRHP